MSPSAAGTERWPSAAASIGCASLTLLVVFLAAGPLTTNDLWWHLVHGRVFLEQGLWHDVDPCLATGRGGAVPHQWLFAVTARGVEVAFGLHGLRVVHTLVVLSIAGLAFGVLRREAGRLAPAACATAVFLVLAWYRLVQLRPELFSIAAVLLLERLLFAPVLPSWRRVGWAVALIAVWANVHAAFLVGPLLLIAALAGVVLQGLAAHFAGLARLAGGAFDRARFLRLASALGGGLVAALLNPRGIGQHLAFWSSSREGSIWGVVDEWAPFAPFSHTNIAPAVSDLAWVVTDVLLLGFALLVIVGGVRFVRSRTRERLDAWDPVRLCLGLAGCVALLASIRFSWLAVFPLLYALASLRRGGVRLWPERMLAVATLLLAAAFPLWGGFRAVAAVFPREPSAWLRDTTTERRFFSLGVRFLEQTGVSGTLFHPYGMGGFLCHQLGPGLRTFVDGSMNVDDDVATDYRKVIEHAGTSPGETAEDVLRRRRVDLFFGVGVPVGPARPGDTEAYTTTLLERQPGWILVSRSLRHAIYVRDDAANHANRERIANWYAAQAVPFDPVDGFDPGRAIDAVPEWAEAWQLVPAGWREQRATSVARAPGRTAAALETVGLAYALVGAYAEQIASDQRTLELRPRAKQPRRRLVYGLLHAGRVSEARLQAEALMALDPLDPRSAAFARGVERVASARTASERNVALAALPLLSSRNPLRQ
jgi:hypothetical protein